ncbi:MAG: SagB/ThcOx family dehydrogenase [Planctomycetes bacterium]|nr:SagB/ThcOx family dehydrogenase [Planctomycetota bacterium]
MPDRLFARTYHQQTKYHPSSIGAGHQIDWENPPEQFKEYAGAPKFDLRPYLPNAETETWQALPALNDPDGTFSLPQLSKLLFATNGITAVMLQGGQKHYFRAAPSAGALYPTDLYLAVRGHADLPDGIFYYHAREHTLLEVYPRGLGPEGDELFRKLAAACFDDRAVASASVAVIATAVFWRSAWRYGARAYRRCLLDSGHVIGNFDIIAPRLGIACTIVGGFVDSEVAALLAIPEAREGVLGVLPLHDLDDRDDINPGPSARASSSTEPKPEADEILSIHTAGAIRRKDAPAPGAANDDDLLPSDKYAFAPGVKLKPSDEDLNDQIEIAILRRRSTRVFTGEPLKLTELADMLAFAYRPDLRLPPEAGPVYFDKSLLETFVVVNAVEGVAPGVYHFAPNFMELLTVRKGPVRREIYHLALGQELARDAGAVLIHTADLDAATRRYGSRAYRYLHLDAGHLGQRLNVAAIRINAGVSGIGGFFDDEVNELLNIPEKELCVYITCLGRAAN